MLYLKTLNIILLMLVNVSLVKMYKRDENGIFLYILNIMLLYEVGIYVFKKNIYFELFHQDGIFFLLRCIFHVLGEVERCRWVHTYSHLYTTSPLFCTHPPYSQCSPSKTPNLILIIILQIGLQPSLKISRENVLGLYFCLCGFEEHRFQSCFLLIRYILKEAFYFSL